MKRICLLSLLVMSVSALAMPPDSELKMPDEEPFGVMTIEGINQVEMFERCPEQWKKIDLTGKWKKKELSSEQIEDILEKRKEVAEKQTLEKAENQLNGITEKDGDEWDPKNLKADYGKTLKRLRKQVESESLAGELPGYVAPESSTESKPAAENLPGCWTAEFSLDQPVDPRRNSVRIFCSPSWNRKLFVNGELVIDHKASWCVWDVDITDRVRQGKNTVEIMGCASPLQWAHVVVGPPLYVKRLLLNPETGADVLHIELLVFNGREETIATSLKVDIAPWERTGDSFDANREQKLDPGKNKLSWDVPVKGIEYWSPDSPALYVIKVSDTDGNVLGIDRFGFRDFRCDGKGFYLNGKPIFMPGIMWTSIYDRGGRTTGFIDAEGLGEHDPLFIKRYQYGYLKGLKQAGVNSIRTHADSGIRGRPLFEACDELGILHYDDIQVWRVRLREKAENPVEHMASECDKIENWLYFVNNHPSTVMFSLGNEQYKARSENLNLLYDRLKSVDPQKRPICSSTGRIRLQLNMKWFGDRTDFADDHNYYGTLGKSWLYNRWYFRDLEADIARAYGTNVLPLVNYECVAVFPGHAYGDSKMAAEMHNIMIADPVDRAAYVEAFTRPNVYGWEMITRHAICQEGMFARYTDEIATHEYCAGLIKRFIELYRQQGILKGIGLHQAGEYLIYADGYKNVLKNVEKRAPEGPYRCGIDPTRKSFIWTPALRMMKRCYSPEFISARWFDGNLIAGQGAIDTDICLVKDTNTEGSFKARMILRDAADSVVDARTLDFGKLNGFANTNVPYSFDIPENAVPGDYTLDMFLFRNEEQVCANSQALHVFSPEIASPGIATDRKVAAYLGESETGKTTLAMLQAMGLDFKRIEDFSGLQEFDVLIVGVDAMDSRFQEAGQTVADWIKKGGKALFFEQNKEDKPIPWLPGVSVCLPGRRWVSEFADIVERNHPVFEGLESSDFDTWSGDGILFRRVLGRPIPPAIAIGAYGYVLENNYGATALADINLDNGIVVLNQFDIVRRYGKDGVATLLANNLVRYILSGNFMYSYTLDGKMCIAVNSDYCTLIDMGVVVNAGLSLASGDGLDSGLDGMLGEPDGDGGVDLSSMPQGEQTLKGVPFRVAGKGGDGENACIRLGALDDTVEGIEVKGKFGRIFFLHTYSGPKAGKGSEVYCFMIHYADGKTERLPIRIGMETENTPHVGDVSDSFLAWKDDRKKMDASGAFITEWINPHPEVGIESIDFVRSGEGSPVLIAITGFREN